MDEKPPFSGLSPLSSKIFGTPQVTQFLESPTVIQFAMQYVLKILEWVALYLLDLVFNWNGLRPLWIVFDMDLGLLWTMDLGPVKSFCYILHGLMPRALKQSLDLGVFNIKYHLLEMFLIAWEAPGFDWKESFWFPGSKNTKIPSFIKMD